MSHSAQPPAPQTGSADQPPAPPQFANARDAKAQAAAEKAYRKASRPWYKKKRFLLPLALLLVILLMTATGGGGDEPATTAESSADGAAAPADSAADAAEDAPFEAAFPGATEEDVVVQAGEEVDAEGVRITAAPLAPGDDTFGETLCSNVTYNNGTDEPASFNGGFDWKLQDPNGVILSNTFTGSDNGLESGELAPGGTLNADVCFEAPAGNPAGQYVVLLDPTFRFSSDRIAWLNTL